MKKILSVLLLISVILPICSFFSFAEETTESNIIKNFDIENSVSFSCKYDSDEKNIDISGTVSHDVLIHHDNYTLNIYSVPIGRSVDDVLKDESQEPLASTSIAIKFKFIVEVDSIEKKFTRYAVALVDTDGNKFLAAEPKFPEVSSDVVYSTGKSHFKGIETSNSNMISSGEAGTVIININPEAMYGQQNEFQYPMTKMLLNISRSYIEGLDKKVKNASANGAKVYLRLLLPTGQGNLNIPDGDKTSVKYEMPNITSEQAKEHLSAFVGFLSERYSSYENGKISGFVLGTMTDQAHTHNFAGENISIEHYSELMALYMIIVGNTARIHDPSLDILLPLSRVNDYTSDNTVIQEKNFSPSMLIKNIVSVLNSSLSEEFDFSILLETTISPKGINNNTLGNIHENSVNDKSIHVDNINHLTDYLKSLHSDYEYVPENIIYLWQVGQNISGTALATAYAYSYYSLLPNKYVSSFVVSFSATEQNPLTDTSSDIKHLFKYIDTYLGFEYTNNYLQYFGAENWFSVVSDNYSGDHALRTIYEPEATEKAPSGINGSFVYYDFSTATDQERLSIISDCSYKASGYTAEGNKAYKLHMTPSSPESFSQILMLNKYSENMIYTPYLSFRIGVDGDSVHEDSLFEIRIQFGKGNCSTSFTCIVNGKSNKEFYINAADYVESNKTDYIRISSRCLNEDIAEYNLWLYNISGHSTDYTSDELDNLITEERSKIQGLAEESKNNTSNTKIIIGIIIATSLVALLGIALYMAIHKSEEKRSDRNDE